MTVSEHIESRIARLKTPQKKALISFLDMLDAPAPKKKPRTKITKAQKIEIDAAIRGIAGMWKDRTDLPKDPVMAVKVLRDRMKSKGRNG